MMASVKEQQRKLLKAKIALALFDELGRRPTEQEVAKFYLAARVLIKVIFGTRYLCADRAGEGR
jgi:hypothetical protein